MAEIVLGLGTSHSPMLSLPGDMWGDYAARDKGNPMLLSLSLIHICRCRRAI